MRLVEAKKYKLILYLICPFLAVISIFFNNRTNFSRNVFWFFIIYYGFTFSIIDESVDASRYYKALVHFSNEVTSFKIFLDTLYNPEVRQADILLPMILFLISRITTDVSWLFGTFAMIFGFFYTRNVWIVASMNFKKVPYCGMLLVISLLFIIPFWYINGFRFWTAAHIFLYGVLNYFYFDKRRFGSFFVLISLFAHFTFFIPISIFFIYRFLGNRYNLYFVLFLFSFGISNFDYSIIKNNLGLLPSFAAAKYSSYYHESYLDTILNTYDARNWYIKYYSVLFRYFVIFLLLLIHWKYRSLIKNDRQLFSLFNFCFLFFAFANFLNLFPSGNRFMTIAVFMSFNTSLIFMFGYVQNTIWNKSLNPFVWLVLGLFIIVNLRIWFDSATLSTFIGNPLTLILFNDFPSLINFIK